MRALLPVQLCFLMCVSVEATLLLYITVFLFEDIDSVFFHSKVSLKSSDMPEV